MEPRFHDRVVFVTGGGSGIGERTSERFSEEGAVVIVSDISADSAAAVAGRLDRGSAIALDVSEPEAVEQAIEEIVSKHGRVDVIFNNAGIDVPLVPLHETPNDLWRRIMSVNGDGFFWVLKFGIAAMLRTGGGSIVNNASIAGMMGLPGKAPYSFAKAGIIGLTKSAAVEYAGKGIRVNTVAPGVTTTPLATSLGAKHDPSRTPMPGVGVPDDIADAVLFLASDQARRITGQTIPVDGGSTVR